METANELELTWLTRYPLPTEVVCDGIDQSEISEQNLKMVLSLF